MSSVFQPRGPAPRRKGNEWAGEPGHGALMLREANGASEMQAIWRLRGLCFRGCADEGDADAHDEGCTHLWIGRADGPPLATLRARHHVDEASLQAGYSAGFFDLAPLAALPGTALELGRLCLHPRAPSGEVMRLVWTGIARLCAQAGARRLIGCTSLPGAAVERHGALLAHLAARHLGPLATRPRARGRLTHRFAQKAGEATGGRPAMPTILRFYLSLGGWVSDELARDPDLDTCVLFTCVEIDAMPAARRRLMQALAAGDDAGGDGGRDGDGDDRADGGA